ncbi:MAG: SsrA-binding protein SmpB [Patescibacteria group bacterium]|nr:SsrA-binding protein SmpB [Patescibacteria group bacterium]
MSIAINKKALFDYEILEKLEAGLVLTGQEVKSVKNGQINLKGSYVTLKDGEAYLLNAHISPYKKAGILKDYNPTRSRKLLLHKKELTRLIGKSQEKGLTIIPLKVYTKGRGKIKIEIGIGRGKKKYEKRETIKKREVEREIRQKMKE